MTRIYLHGLRDHHQNRLAIIGLGAVLWVGISTSAMALPNNGTIPILAYHSWDVPSHQGLKDDLELADTMGFKVIPVFWATQWMLSQRDGATLPQCVVGITFDDGQFSDWNDWPEQGVVGFKKILEDFRATHNQPNTHAASFVVGSPVARNWINGGLTEDWWSAANASGIIEIYNHGADHDHPHIDDSNHDQVPDFPSGHCSLLDSNFTPDTYVAVGDPSGQGGIGLGNPARINTLVEARKHIVRSAQYIASKISPAYPDLFAYPTEAPDPYIPNTYFPLYMAEHGTIAAFVGAGFNPLTNPANYMSRSTNRWLVPRFFRGFHYFDAGGLATILQAAAIGNCVQ